MDQSDRDAVCRRNQTQLLMLTDQTAFVHCSVYISNKNQSRHQKINKCAISWKNYSSVMA